MVDYRAGTMCIHIHIYTYLDVYIYTYTYIYRHGIHIHTYIYIYIYRHGSSLDNVLVRLICYYHGRAGDNSTGPADWLADGRAAGRDQGTGKDECDCARRTRDTRMGTARSDRSRAFSRRRRDAMAPWCRAAGTRRGRGRREPGPIIS